MRTATGLTLLAIGAIFTFAVSAHPAFLNLQVAGVVIMATGIAGLSLRKPSQGWLRRRTVLRKRTGGPVVGHVDETRYPPYVMLSPGADPVGSERQPGDLTAGTAHEAAAPGQQTASIPDLPADDLTDGLTAGQSDAPQTAPVSEVVEEYIDE